MMMYHLHTENNLEMEAFTNMAVFFTPELRIIATRVQLSNIACSFLEMFIPILVQFVPMKVGDTQEINFSS